MTEISFHFNAPDKINHTCRVLRKACNAGHRVNVVGKPEILRQIDVALWTFSPLDFVPHCFADAAASLLAHTPVVLGQAESASGQAGSNQMLINLDAHIPAGFERYERVIELVGLDDADRQHARERWKHYAARGYAIVRHDLSASAP